MENDTVHISVASDFSEFPAGRYLTDGPYSGERFREEFIKPNIEAELRLDIDLDGTEGYGSSFLDEAFGGLVRKGYADAKTLRNLISISAPGPYERYGRMAWAYIEQSEFGTEA